MNNDYLSNNHTEIDLESRNINLPSDSDAKRKIIQSQRPASIYDEPNQWLQLKGDPAIRGGLFNQQRVESLMDQQMNQAMQKINELILYHGVFQINLHFSSSRATVWFTNSPHKYRLLDSTMLIQSDLLLTYPIQYYPDEAKIKQEEIDKILGVFRKLRLIDDIIYLRSASINIFNGLVSLTFSCDGSHYLPHTDLLNPEHNFWKNETGYC